MVFVFLVCTFLAGLVRFGSFWFVSFWFTFLFCFCLVLFIFGWGPAKWAQLISPTAPQYCFRFVGSVDFQWAATNKTTVVKIYRVVCIQWYSVFVLFFSRVPGGLVRLALKLSFSFYLRAGLASLFETHTHTHAWNPQLWLTILWLKSPGGCVVFKGPPPARKKTKQKKTTSRYNKTYGGFPVGFPLRQPKGGLTQRKRQTQICANSIYYAVVDRALITQPPTQGK